MKKRILSALLALAMTFSMLPAAAMAADVKDFTDLNKDAWYYSEVSKTVKLGYMAGTSATTFSPDMALDRAQFVVIIAAIEGVEVDNTKETKFSDVPANTWYTGAVNWAAKNGITAGTGDGSTFEPTKAITREEMATMMNAYIKKCDPDTSNKAKADEFVDIAEVSEWANGSVEAIRKAGLTAGVPGVVDGKEVRYFLPAKTATRAEIAAVVNELAAYVGGNGGNGGNGGTESEPVDYIYNALNAVVETIKADTGIDNDETGYVQVTGLELSKDFEGDVRPQKVTGVIEVEKDVIEAMLEKALEYAMPIYNDFVAAEDKKAEAIETATEIAQTVIEKFEAETGYAIGSKEEIKALAADIAQELVDGAKAAPDYVRNLWNHNFKKENGYVIGDITISSEYGAEAVINVDESGIYYAGDLKAAAVDVAELALAIAKDLYADLKARKDYTAITEIELNATVNVHFADGAYAEDTAEFPHNYPVTVALDLEGDVLDNIEYKYVASGDVHQYVKVIVPAAVGQTYTQFANELVKSVISPVITAKMNEALGGMFAQPAAATYAITFAPAIDTDALMNDAINAWLEKNLTTGDMANSALVDYLNGNKDAELDNEVIYDMIDTTLEDTVNELMGDTIIPGGVLAQQMAQNPETLKETLQSAAPEAYEKLEDLGLTDYAVAKTQDYLDPAKAEETGKSYADEKREEMKESVDSVITSTIDKVLEPETETETPDVELPEGSVPEVVVPDVSKYVAALNLVAKMSSFETVKNAEFSNIAAALRNETVQGFIGTKGDAYVAQFAGYVAKLPAAAAIEIDGVVVNEAALDEVIAAETTVELCEAVANLIDQFGDMSIASFEDGVDFVASYGSKAHGVNLVVDFQ